MRRFLAFTAIILLACLTVAACGSSKPAASSSSASSSAASSAVTATGAFGKAPTVTIPKAKAGGSLTVRTLIQGTGPVVTKNDAMAANFVIYFWDGTTSALKGSTFGNSPTLIPSKTLPGLQTALVGKKVGSRVLAVIPPALGYGTSGNAQLGVTGTTTLVLVVDLLNAYSNTEGAMGAQVSDGGGTLPTVSVKSGVPTLSFTSSTPPSGLVTKTLVKGNGPKIVKGEYVIAQYVGYIWRSHKTPFGSSWSSGTPFGFVIDASPEQVIPGWDKGLTGQTVGSRVMLSVPPAQGYGSSGQAAANIKGTDTLVFVVDIIDALK